MDVTHEALTLSEAAAILDVSNARVSQLLREDRLLGPTVAKGGGRAPKNAPRVWRQSLDDYAANPQNRKPGRPASKGPNANEGQAALTSHLFAENGRLRAREASARHVALEMKAIADQQRADLAKERRERAALATEVSALRAEIEGIRQTIAERDRALSQYSDSLTTLLADDHPDMLAVGMSTIDLARTD